MFLILFLSLIYNNFEVYISFLTSYFYLFFEFFTSYEISCTSEEGNNQNKRWFPFLFSNIKPKFGDIQFTGIQNTINIHTNITKQTSQIYNDMVYSSIFGLGTIASFYSILNKKPLIGSTIMITTIGTSTLFRIATHPESMNAIGKFVANQINTYKQNENTDQNKISDTETVLQAGFNNLEQIIDYFFKFIRPVSHSFDLPTQINITYGLIFVIFILLILVLFLILFFITNLFLLTYRDKLIDYFKIKNIYILTIFKFFKIRDTMTIVIISFLIIINILACIYGLHYILTHPIFLLLDSSTIDSILNKS